MSGPDKLPSPYALLYLSVSGTTVTVALHVLRFLDAPAPAAQVLIDSCATAVAKQHALRTPTCLQASVV